MHDSMMIADVGFIENVSGSRIATPLAPPSPGSTPISTPSRMPISMNSRFFQVSATAKPCIRLPRSSTSVADQVLERPFRQRHQEPELEHEEERDRQAGADRERRQQPVLSLPQH